MAKTAGQLLTNVLARVRDPNAIALATNTAPTTTSGQTFGYILLTQAQFFINTATVCIISSASLTLSPSTVLYAVFSNLASCIKVTAVTGFGNKNLMKADWKSFGRADRKWLVHVGSEPRNWAPIGNELIAIVPAVTSNVIANFGTATVDYVKLTNTVAMSSDTFDLPDDLLGQVETLASLFAMLKTKQLADFNNSFQRLIRYIGPAKTWCMDDTNKAI